MVIVCRFWGFLRVGGGGGRMSFCRVGADFLGGRLVFRLLRGRKDIFRICVRVYVCVCACVFGLGRSVRGWI